MTIKNKIAEITQKYPKHYSKMIQRQPDLWSAIVDATPNSTEPASARIYTFLTGDTGICKFGNTGKFCSISEGRAFCGRASVCQCAKDSVSASVSAAKSSRTKEDIDAENQKRKATSLLRYGVINNGQTTTAKKRHSEFYADASKVEAAVQNFKDTMMLHHGVTNPRYLSEVNEKIQETNRIKYGACNPMQNPEIATKSVSIRRDNYDPVHVWKRNYGRFQEMLAAEFNVTVLMNEGDYRGVMTREFMTFKCLSCDHTFSRKFEYHRSPICKVCNPTEKKYRSSEEIAVHDFIESVYAGPILHSDRTIINPYELDIVLPQLKIAVEYCGLYWHSELSGNKAWAYHANKMKIANTSGYRLITIFSDEWKSNQQLVKDKLKHILGVDDSMTVYARKAVAKEIPYNMARSFHQDNHIQGSPKSLGTNIGLFYSDQLVSVGSFVSSGNGQYELVRLSSTQRVVGGAGKIIKHFSSSAVECKSIISFADLRWSDAISNVYISLGFTEVGRVPQMQQYTSGDRRYHKLLFPRSKINPNNEPKTEWEMMQELGYDRIWDCGKIKYELKISR